MVHRDDEHSATKRRYSGSSNTAMSRGEVQTPTFRSEVKDSASRDMGPPNATRAHAMHSSSPDFIREAASNHNTMTYRTPGFPAPATRRSSRTVPEPSTDPRREAPVAPKRKAGSYIVEGYEHERKKRGTKPSTTNVEGEHRYSLRANTSQPSINDLPTVSSMSQLSGSSSQVGRPAGKSRMQTLGGESSRNRQGTSRKSKCEFPAALVRQQLLTHHSCRNDRSLRTRAPLSWIVNV